MDADVGGSKVGGYRGKWKQREMKVEIDGKLKLVQIEER